MASAVPLVERLLGGGPSAGERVLNHGDPADLIPGVAAPRAGADYPGTSNLHAVYIRGSLNVDNLRRAIDALQERHPRMRAKYWENPRTHYNYLLETDDKIPLEVRDGRSADINFDLERALAKEIDTLRGPFCHLVYVRHVEEGTGLLVFGQTHGVGDGRTCEVAMSQLLSLYDGKDVPHYSNSKSFAQVAGKMRPEKMEAWHDIEDLMPRRDHKSVVGTFVEPHNPAFEASFGGCCIELVHLSPEEAKALLQVSRNNKVTLTGTFAAAVHYALLTELVARGRATEFVSLGMDMNMRGRALGPEYDEECGNFVIDTHVFCPLEPDLFETARFVNKILKEIVDKDCGYESSLSGMGALKGRDARMLMRQVNKDQWVLLTGSMEHANVSSLGVLKRFGKYADFEVLENFTMGYAAFLGCKVNCCTSGSSGSFTACVMVTRNVVPDARSLACKLRDHIQGILRGLMAEEGSPQYKAVLTQCTEATEKMRLAAEAAQQRVAKSHTGQDGTPFLGDTSSRHNLSTHLKVAGNVLCSLVAAGCLSGFPLYEPDMKRAGVLSSICGPGVYACAAQDEALATLYQNAQTGSFTMVLLVGYIFDILGARRAALLGAACTAFCLCIIGMVVALDAHAFPWTQPILLYCCFTLSDACGMLSSFGLAGWLWHYPRHQSLFIGLFNGTYQGASAVGLIFTWMDRHGLGLPAGFILVACANLLAAAGFHCCTPSHEEYLEEASRVMCISRDGMDMTRIAKLQQLRLQLRELWGVLKIFPLQNGLFFSATALAGCGLYQWLGAFASTYQHWFGVVGAHKLTQQFVLLFSPLGLVLNPLSGFIMDYISLPAYILAMASMMLGMSLLLMWKDPDAQDWFIVLITTYMGTMQNVLSKWSIMFAPPDLFGICSSSSVLVMGVVGLALDGVVRSSVDMGATAAMLFGSFVLQVWCAAVLLRRGLPTRPPKNMYDSAKRLLRRPLN